MPQMTARTATKQETGPAEGAGERVAKRIARAGVCSRRDAERWIAEGRVAVNGRVLLSPALDVTDEDKVVVDGKPLPARERTRLWLYHKPKGLVTTARDPQGRPTVFAALPPELPRVVTIGRLDINTEGLLLLTNDGGLARILELPATGWLRRYRVRVHGAVTPADLAKLGAGTTVDGVHYGPVEAALERVQGTNAWLVLGLREGKNREVKEVLGGLGLTVNRLIRISFGPFQLGDLEPGAVREIPRRILRDQIGAKLAADAGLDFDAPVRTPAPPSGTKARDGEPARREPTRRSSGRAPRGASAPRSSGRAKTHRA
jgi:23S rRNA pseudouridine2605 synthase